jgi:hypothetical protein
MERMRYKTDKLAGSLCLLALVFDVLHFIGFYSSPTIKPDFRMGIDVIINIIFMLIAFWASEQAKVYDRTWSFIMMTLAAVQTVRVFWLPMHYYSFGRAAGAVVNPEAVQFSGGAFTYSLVTIIASGACMLAAGIVCYLNSTALRKYLNGLGA